jgi:hypothetical protein
MHQIVSLWAQVSSPQRDKHIISATFWNKFIEKQKWHKGLSEWNSFSKPQKPRDIMHYPLLQHTKLWFAKSTRIELDQFCLKNISLLNAVIQERRPKFDSSLDML